MKAAFALSLVLVGACTASLPVPPEPVALAPVVACPPAPVVPPTLPLVVPLERLAAAYHAVDVARQAERHRGDLCAEDVRRQSLWIAAAVERLAR